MFTKIQTLKIQILLLFCGALLTFLVYSNHFNNPFEFDDEHTIVNNMAIRDLKNISLFFKDATTFSSLPSNQAYRPGLTTLNAIDYALGGTEVPDAKQYHISIFISYIALGIFIFFFSKKVLEFNLDKKYTIWCSLFLTTWFWVHTANSACINYIIARSDSFSTLMILLAFVMYQYLSNLRKLYLYSIPVIVGFFVKEPVVMFVPLLLVYKLLFEKNITLKEVFTTEKSKFFESFKEVIVPFIVVVFLYFFSRSMTPVNWTSGATDRLGYLITQPFVILHYFNNFFVPANLVIDTDWTIFKNPFDDRVFVGFAFLIVFVYFIFKLSKNHKPAAFGLAWFLLALAPTSSIFPLAEVLNDHRPFFSYIGLFISTVYGMIYFVSNPNFKYKKIIFVAMPFLLIAHSIGTFSENKKWNSSESIWREATEKAPMNGRAWMNYGNTLMAKGDYVKAEKAFAICEKLMPTYATININLGILNDALGKTVIAEDYFKKALNLDALNPECYSFYGKFLFKANRIAEAKEIVSKGLEVSPKHAALLELNQYLATINSSSNNQVEDMEEKTKSNQTPENYLDLSLQYYNAKQFEKCIEACNEALKLKPDYALAYNNICSSYNELKMWEKAAEAGKRGLAIDPNNELLKGNLNVALNNLKK